MQEKDVEQFHEVDLFDFELCHGDAYGLQHPFRIVRLCEPRRAEGCVPGGRHPCTCEGLPRQGGDGRRSRSRTRCSATSLATSAMSSAIASRMSSSDSMP